MDISESQKKQLQVLAEQGKQISTVAYYKSTVTGNPEVTAAEAGWISHTRQQTGDLVEVIYIK